MAIDQGLRIRKYLWGKLAMWKTHGKTLGQWQFQDPKMEVRLYYFGPYFVVIFLEK
jgi:hypothetical protein